MNVISYGFSKLFIGEELFAIGSSFLYVAKNDSETALSKGLLGLEKNCAILSSCRNDRQYIAHLNHYETSNLLDGH